MKTMTITFRYFFDTFLLMDLVEAVFLILVYVSIFLASKNQLRDKGSVSFLRNSSLIGIILSLVPVIAPVVVCTNCSDLELIMAGSIALSITTLSILPMLLCLGIGFLLFGKRNREIYGNLLFLSGVFWILAFVGNVSILASLSFMLPGGGFNFFLSLFGILNLFLLPALILLIIHGAKMKDKNFILAGVFYILSYLSIFMAWIPLPP